MKFVMVRLPVGSTRAVAVVLLASILATVSLVGCNSFKRKSTLNCSCQTTGCSCPHCEGKEPECHCTSTDAYPSERIGDGHD